MRQFDWLPFYQAIAAALDPYAARRAALYAKIRDLAAQEPLMRYLHFENTEFWQKRNFEVDPFTVMGIFNRATSAAHRHDLAQKIARALGVGLDAPQEFHGIAHLDPRQSIYSGNDALWGLWAARGAWDSGFTAAWDKAKDAHGNGLATLSIGLFWSAPLKYMPLDAISIPYIASAYGLEPLQEKCSGAQYVAYMKELSAKMPEGGFPAVAFAAWESKKGN